MTSPLRPPPSETITLILRRAAADPELNRLRLNLLMRDISRKTDFAFPTVQVLWKSYRRLVQDGKLEASEILEKTLRVKDVRTDSGVAPITVLTKPYPCPGQCTYCPTEARMPKSYVASEPAAARALMLRFDPYEQVKQRVLALERNGHEAKKIELIIKGGTWSSYTWTYRKWFVKRCFDAANHASSGAKGKKAREASLTSAQKTNERAGYRIIGLTIETRPDWVTAQEVIRLRELGCTRVELGVQTLQDSILELTKRGHTIEATKRAVVLLKQAGFKTDFHILPGQPGSTPDIDLKDFADLFSDPAYMPDMVKLYPCVVLPSTELHEQATRGEFTALEGEVLKELLISMQALVPRYCRISRLIRDFPDHEISFGNTVTNLREQIEDEMVKRGMACQCLRCREVGHVIKKSGADLYNAKPQLFEQWYDNAGGRVVFLSMEDPERRAVFAFLRLRLPPKAKELIEYPEYAKDKKLVREVTAIAKAFPVFKGSAFVRELHTYGQALDLSQSKKGAAQHKGYGRTLMKAAEQIAKREGFSNVAVISGIGVRGYYRELGYKLQQTYMAKRLK